MPNTLPVIYEDPYEMYGDPNNRTETICSEQIQNNLSKIINRWKNPTYQQLENIEMTTAHRQDSFDSGYIDPREMTYPTARSTVRDILEKEIKAEKCLREVKAKLEDIIITIEPFDKKDQDTRKFKCCCLNISW